VFALQSPQTTYHTPTTGKDKLKMGSKILIVNPIEQRAPQHSSDPVNAPALVYWVDSGQSTGSGTMRRTYLVK